MVSTSPDPYEVLAKLSEPDFSKDEVVDIDRHLYHSLQCQHYTDLSARLSDLDHVSYKAFLTLRQGEDLILKYNTQVWSSRLFHGSLGGTPYTRSLFVAYLDSLHTELLLCFSSTKRLSTCLRHNHTWLAQVENGKWWIRLVLSTWVESCSGATRQVDLRDKGKNYALVKASSLWPLVEPHINKYEGWEGQVRVYFGDAFLH